MTVELTVVTCIHSKPTLRKKCDGLLANDWQSGAFAFAVSIQCMHPRSGRRHIYSIWPIGQVCLLDWMDRWMGADDWMTRRLTWRPRQGHAYCWRRNSAGQWQSGDDIVDKAGK